MLMQKKQEHKKKIQADKSKTRMKFALFTGR